MRKLLTLIGLCILLSGFAIPKVSAQSLNNFRITSLKADYYLSKDTDNVSQLKTVETVKVQFPTYDQNHGIERAIPKKYKHNSLNVHVDSIVSDTGRPWHYTTRTSNDNLILRIGDANRYVQGEQTYVITYTERNVITFYNDHDEWYWDVNGTEWLVPFDSVQATIHLGPELTKALKPDMLCYTGQYGFTAKNCSITRQDGANDPVIAVSTVTGLSSSESLTFVLGFQPHTFAKYHMKPALLAAIIAGILAVTTGPSLLVLAILLPKWRRLGRDAKGTGVIVPQYTPIKDVNPVLSDTILHQNLRTVAISAGMLELCLRKYLKLYEVTKDKLLKDETQYEVELIKDPADLGQIEKEIIGLLFQDSLAIGSRVNLSTMKNKLYTGVRRISNLSAQMVADQGYFRQNPATARGRYVGWGTLLLILGFGGVFFYPPILLGTAGLGVAGIITLIISGLMPALTKQGIDAKEYLLGLKDYMQLAEADRLKVLQGPTTAEKFDVGSQAQLVKLYEKLLPYAMLFGIEKEWAAQFANMYEQPPDWYSGTRPFQAVYFANAISGFSTASVNSFATPSSSGSSGFSGGGFSGGGGGGGGGGGW